MWISATQQGPGYIFPVSSLNVRAYAVLGLILLCTGCRHRHPHQVRVSPPTPQTKPSARPPSGGAPTSLSVVQGEEGLASWYGQPYHGRPTSSGEIYNMYDFTAAHRTLPFGAQVRVHDLDNGNEVTVRINDRGPFVEGRIIDLSYGAAQSLGMVGPGIARVRLEIEGLPPPGSPGAQPGIYAVQVGAFRNLENAQRLRDLIASHFGPVMIQSFDRGDGVYHRVRVGRESTEEEARVLAEQLRNSNLIAETYVVRLN